MGRPCLEVQAGPFAATPPPRTIDAAPISRAALAVLATRTSTTESWKPQASSAVVPGDRLASGSSATPSSARAAATIRRAAVLSPEKLKSYESPSQALGNAASRREAPSAAFWIAGPPG